MGSSADLGIRVAILNVGFLTFDIYLAHSVNQFRNQAEYIPLIFSAGAPLVVILASAVCAAGPQFGRIWAIWLAGWLCLSGLQGLSSISKPFFL